MRRESETICFLKFTLRASRVFLYEQGRGPESGPRRVARKTPLCLHGGIAAVGVDEREVDGQGWSGRSRRGGRGCGRLPVRCRAAGRGRPRAHRLTPRPRRLLLRSSAWGRCARYSLQLDFRGGEVLLQVDVAREGLSVRRCVFAKGKLIELLMVSTHPPPPSSNIQDYLGCRFIVYLLQKMALCEGTEQHSCS